MNALTVTGQPTASATARDWAVFLRPLLASIANPPSREDFALRCEALAAALPDAAAEMLVSWRQEEAMRRFHFMPSVAEVADWLREELAGRRETASRVSAYLPAREALPAPSSCERTVSEIEAVRAKVQEFMAERNLASVLEREEVKPAYLTETMLLRQYETMGKAGEVRAAALRRKLGLEGV